MNYTGGSFPEQLRSGRVSADFFKLTGAPVILGRTFLAGRGSAERPAGRLISRRLWETRFSADPNVVGKSMSLGGEPYTIVGVLGEFDFREFGPTPQVWTLFQFDPNTADQGHYFQALGRLKPGVTLQQADARLKASAADFRKKFPTALGPQNTFGVAHGPRRDRRQRDAAVAVDLRRRGQLRAADRVRQCRQPAAGARHRAPARDRDPCGHRRLSRPHHPPAAHRKRRAVARWRRLRPVCRLGGDPGLLSINTAGLPRVGENGTLVGLDWTVVAFTMGVSLADRHDLRPDPRPAELEDRLDDDAEGERGAFGNRLPAEQGPLRPRGRSRSRSRSSC